MNDRGKKILTGVKDMDINILLELDIDTLGHMCLTNKYVKSLCTNTFFQQKFKQDKRLIIPGYKPKTSD